MELVPEGKNFRLVKEEELAEIVEFLEQYLPDSLKSELGCIKLRHNFDNKKKVTQKNAYKFLKAIGILFRFTTSKEIFPLEFHQTVKTYLNDRVWDFYFYVNKSWPERPVCLHFPGMTGSPNGLLYESFCVFSPIDQLDNLEQLEQEDVLIDWSRPIYLNFTHHSIISRLESFYQSIGTMEKIIAYVYVCNDPTSTDVPPEQLLGEEAEMMQLKTEHAKAIHDLYPANTMEGVEIFEKLINTLPAYGIFSNGELAAWMVQSYYGAMFSMQTRPEFRRKGYGIHLAKFLTKAVSSRGYIPHVVIRPDNDASQSLYLKLGFEKYYQTVRAILWPHDYDESSRVNEGEGQTSSDN